MARIPAVGGEIDSSQFGVTLVHEHLCFRADERFKEKNMEYQVSLARRAAAVGVNTIVDLSAWGEPDIRQTLELKDRAPEVNFILCTGAYLEGAVSEEVRGLSEDRMFERMVRQLTEGYEGTTVRPGIIKVAGAKSILTDWEKKNFRAAARAQRECRVPIATHACAGAREQMELLRESGADIGATFYSHVEAEFGWDGRSLEEEARYLEDVARAGGYLQFNNFDFEFDTPFPDMLHLINYMEERGLGDRVLLSIDCNWQIDEDGRIWHEAEKEHPETGKRTYAYMMTNAVPMLMGAGVSLQRINRYLVENPRRLFETAMSGNI